MKNELMSSEDSDIDTPDTVTVRPLTWRSEYVNRMFQQIDKYSAVRKSPQARRQTKGRVIGSSSSRSQPSDVPSWAVVKL